MHYKGEGIAKDRVEAVKWFRKAAEQGNADAQFMLGLIYYKGEGVAKDLVEAHAWWEVAEAAGNGDARKNLKSAEKVMLRAQIAEATKLARERSVKFRKND